MDRPFPWIERLGGIYELEAGHSRRIITMEGARGFAVALVFFVHYRAAFGTLAGNGTWTAGISRALWAIGHTGVDLFFVLSGYLIYGAVMKPSIHYGRFMVRRVRRIYPTFLAVFAIYLALCFLFPEQNKLPQGAWAASLYVIENLLLLPGIFPIEAIITVAWSLSYEFFYYLTLPLLVIGLRMQRWAARWRVAFFSLFAAAFVVSWFVASPKAPRLVMFIAGILVYEGVHSLQLVPRLSRRAEWAILALTIAALGAVAALPSASSELRTILVFVAFGLFAFGCFRAEGPLYRLLAVTPLRWLGNMSYSYYLIHALTLNAAALLLAPLLRNAARPMLYWALMPVLFATTLLTATLLFLLVEKPFSLARRPSIPHPAATLAADAPPA